MPQARYILLPILGACAAIAAFRLAMPYEGTLDRPSLGIDDPKALFTYGTTWGAVNRIAFGAFLCGSFCLVLTLGRRSLARVLIACALGTGVGAGVNFVTDSSADIIGIRLSGSLQNLGTIVAMLAWCVFVPAGISFTIAFSVGITPQRIKRAIYATKTAALASIGVQVFGSVFATGGGGEAESVGALLRSQIPVWRTVEIAVGIALGITMAIADELIRVGSVRLVHGRNEFRDWSLDHDVNRVGSAEECEIPLRGFKGIAPVHALLVKQGPHFFLDPKAPTLVNGQPSDAVALNPGDQIVIGDVTLVFYTRDLILSSSYTSPYSGFQPVSPTFQAATPYQNSPARLLFASTGQELRLPSGRYGVGRDATNAVCLNNDSGISRRHAELVVSDTGLELIDLGSKNGTLLNGQRLVGHARLVSGDTMEFGTAKFTYYR